MASIEDREGRKSRLVKGFAEGLELLGELPGDDDPESLGRAAALTLPRPWVWEERFGPLLTSAEIRNLLGGISREALAQRVKRGTLFGLRDERSRVRYPLMQLDEEARTPLKGLPALIKLFRGLDLSGWELASFLTAVQPELDGQPPTAWLAEGREPELVFAVASEAAETLAR